MDYSSSHDMDMDDLSQWPVQQRARRNSEEAIDPRLLGNFGTWSSEGSNNATNGSTEEQAVQEFNRTVDVDMTHATAAPTDTQPTFPPHAIHEWQVVQTPRHQTPTRQQQHMLPTPDTSRHSHQRGQNASAYQHVAPAWDPNNPYSMLDIETAQMPQHQDLAAADPGEQYEALTPTSQPRFFGDVPVAPSPLANHGHLPHHHDEYGQPMQGQPHFAVNVHGWDQTNMAPSEDIPTWSEGPYHVPNALNTLPLPPNTTYNINNGKKEASLHSGVTNGSFICSCGKPHDSKSELDHHARNHDPKKRIKLCPICGKDFLFEKDVKRHMKKHQQERHIFCNYRGCPWRDKGFKRQDHLERHLKTKHKQEGDA